MSKLLQYKNYWLFAVLIIISHTVDAKIIASVDRNEIHAGETFQLTIEMDEDSGEEPDLSLIPKDFTIVSNSQYQQMSFINGQGTTIKGWKIKLSTLKTGKATIPAISVGNQFTKPIHLNILRTSDRVDLGGNKKAIFLEAKIDHQSVYVQQQILFTIKLYRAVNTHYARLTEPDAKDSIIEKLGDDVQYDKHIDGTRYVVTERRYAIFPQQSGQLKIGAINFTADVNDPNQRGRNRFLNTTRPISVNSDTLSVEVKPQPPQSATPWMPASEVVLADQWSPQTQELTVGEPVTWTLLLSAQGLSESQIATIDLPKVDGLQWYPDTPQKERQVNQKGILGQRIEKFAVIPSREGTISVPEISIKWWDVNSDTEKTARIPGKTFTVLPNTNAQVNNQPPQMLGPKPEIPQSEISTQADPIWRYLTVGFASLWVVTLLFMFLSRQSTQKTSSQRKPKSQSSLGNNDHFNELLKSIKNKDIKLIEKQLIAWSSSVSNTKFHSLGQLASTCTDLNISESKIVGSKDADTNISIANIQSKLQSLDEARYANGSMAEIQLLTKDELKILGEILARKSNQESATNLPPLYG